MHLHVVFYTSFNLLYVLFPCCIIKTCQTKITLLTHEVGENLKIIKRFIMYVHFVAHK